MIALSLFNLVMVMLNIDNVLTYRQNRLRIVTPTNQQSGNIQGNFTSNINFMFPPLNSINTFPGNITANGALPSFPVASQLTPTDPAFRENGITPTGCPIVTVTNEVLPSPTKSQMTPTNPVLRENAITSTSNPTVAVAKEALPSPTESQITPTGPVLRGSDSTSTSNPTVAVTSEAIPSPTEIQTTPISPVLIENNSTSTNSTTITVTNKAESQTTPASPVLRENNITSKSNLTVTVTSEALPSPAESQVTPIGQVSRGKDVTSISNPTIATTSEALPSPTKIQTTPVSPILIENNITSTNSPIVTVTNEALPPLTESQTTPANPVLRENNITSTSSSTVTVTSEALPPPIESQASPANPVLKDNDITSTNSPIVTVENEAIPSPTESQTAPTSQVTKENDITSPTSPTAAGAIGTTPTVTEVVINSPTNGSSLNITIEIPISINVIITPSDNSRSGLSTSPSLELPPVGSTTVPARTVSGNSEDNITTVSKIPVTSANTTIDTPLSSPTTVGSTVVETTIENLLSTTTTSKNTVTSVSENSSTTISAVGSTVELVTENITSNTTENTASTTSEIVTTSPSTVGSSNETDVETVISPSTIESTQITVSDNPITFPDTNDNTVSSLSDNPITTPSTNEKIVQSLTENPVNINLSDPAANGNPFIFTTQSSLTATTTTTNIDLSDSGQNGINFGFTPSSGSGTQNIQNKMIYQKKCEEYYNMGSRKARTAKVQVFIVGGTNSLPNEFPHMAALGYNQEPKEWLCGGSLISENFVITAAHCLSSSTLGEIQFVRLGTTYLQTETLESEDYNVIRRIPHPEYSSGMQYNDIALLQLDRPVTFSESIQPICLSSAKNIAQRTLIATGWGKTEPTGDVSPELQKVDLEYFPNSECQRVYSVVSPQDLPRGIDDRTQICAGSRNEEKDTCQGDSGGPLQIEENGRFYLVGITSFGLDCGRPGSPGVYTRVSYYIPWIEEIVWANQH